MNNIRYLAKIILVAMIFGSALWISDAFIPRIFMPFSFLLFGVILYFISGGHIKTRNNLSNNETLFETIIDQTPIPISFYDPEGVMRRVNPAFEKLWGTKMDQFIGRLNILDEPQSRSTGIAPYFKKALGGLSQVLPDKLYDPKEAGLPGQARWLRNFLFPVKDKYGNIVNIVLIHEDVTNHKISEEKIIKSEEKFRNLFNQSTDGIFIHDLEGNILEVNPKVLSQFGYTKDEILKMKIIDLHPAYALPDSQKAFETIQKNGAVNFEIDFKKKNNEIFNAAVASSLYEIDGKKVIQGMVRDISERKQAEKELRESRRKLEISERLASLGRISAGLAHELNNPLTGLLGIVQLVLKEMDPKNPIRKDLEVVEESALRTKSIIYDLLHFTKSVEPDFKTIDVRDPISHALRLSRMQITSKAIETKVSLPDDLPKIQGDSGQLLQVFLNLIYNAIDAIENNGEIRIEGAVDQDRKNVILQFKDNGHGIPPDYLNHIFEPFFTTKRGEKGTGLGLSICFSIIVAHGGDITCRSSPKDGTIFTIKLPVKRLGGSKNG